MTTGNWETNNIALAEKTGGKELSNREKLKHLSQDNLLSRLLVSNNTIERLSKQNEDLKKALRDKERINTQLEVDLRRARGYLSRLPRE